MKKIDILTELTKEVHAHCPRATSDVLQERLKQKNKWGEQNHDPYKWLAILQEEVGEFCAALLKPEFGGVKGGERAIKTEVLHVAAVALAMVECCNRKKWGLKT